MSIAIASNVLSVKGLFWGPQSIRLQAILLTMPTTGITLKHERGSGKVRFLKAIFGFFEGESCSF